MDGWTAGSALQAARESAGLSLRRAAEKIDSVAPQTLSGWEARDSGPPTSMIDTLDRVYRQDGALGGVIRALRIGTVVPTDIAWGAHPGPGPAWAWFRAPDATTADVVWGPWRAVVDVPAGPAGIVVTTPVALPNPPLLVRFAAPGRVDVTSGATPRWLPAPVIDGFGLVRPTDGAARPLWWLAARLSQVAPWALESAAGIGIGVPAMLRRHATSSAPPLPPMAVPAVNCAQLEHRDGALAHRARQACGDSRVDVAVLVNAIDGSPWTTESDVRTLEQGRSPVDRAAAVDTLFGLDGRSVVGPFLSGRDALRVSFPTFWRGPVWVAFETDRPRRATLAWAGHRKRLELAGSSVVTCRKSYLDQPPLVIDAFGCRITAGIGRAIDAVDVNPAWDLSQDVFARYRDDLIGMLTKTRPRLKNLLERAGISLDE